MMETDEIKEATEKVKEDVEKGYEVIIKGFKHFATTMQKDHKKLNDAWEEMAALKPRRK